MVVLLARAPRRPIDRAKLEELPDREELQPHRLRQLQPAVPEEEGRGPGEAHAAPLGNNGRDDGVDAPLLVYSFALALEDLAQAHARQEVGEVRHLLELARQRSVAVGDPPLGGQLDLLILPGLDLVPVQVPGLDDLLHGGVSGQPPGAGLRLVCWTTFFLR